MEQLVVQLLIVAPVVKWTINPKRPWSRNFGKQERKHFLFFLHACYKRSGENRRKYGSGIMSSGIFFLSVLVMSVSIFQVRFDARNMSTAFFAPLFLSSKTPTSRDYRLLCCSLLLVYHLIITKR